MMDIKFIDGTTLWIREDSIYDIYGENGHMIIQTDEYDYRIPDDNVKYYSRPISMVEQKNRKGSEF